MSRRSVDTDREHDEQLRSDDYAAIARSSYDHTRTEYEPGEIRARQWEVEGSAGTTSRGSRSPWDSEREWNREERAPRNNGRERDRKEVTIALEGFSRSAFILACQETADKQDNARNFTLDLGPSTCRTTL